MALRRRVFSVKIWSGQARALNLERLIAYIVLIWKPSDKKELHDDVIIKSKLKNSDLRENEQIMY